MKKSLIALAVAGVFAAPAFAATSNVDVYGKLHVSINFVDDQPDNISDLNFTSNASRIGFKGSEDLGGGLKGVWQIESAVNLDEQSGTLGGRNSYLGVAGGFGTVLLGNHDTPLKLIGRKVDLFGDTFADSRNVMGGGSDTRARNVLAYVSPDWGGFKVLAAYTTDLTGGGNNGDADDNDAWNISGEWGSGPFWIGGAYGDGDAHSNIGADGHWRLAGSFSFGDFKIVGQYDDLEDVSDGWMIGGSFKMGAITLKANWMDGDLDGSNADPEQWAIGADYTLSKRTSAYLLYVAGENVVLGAGGGASDRIGSCSTCGGDISSISAGLVHTF